jgi:hypothetical protein
MATDNWCICGHHKDKHCISGTDHSNKSCKAFFTKFEICTCLEFSPNVFYHKNNHSIPPERLTKIFIK